MSYFRTYLILMVLLALTVTVAQVPLAASIGLTLSVVIASTKAVLIALVFMHLKGSPKPTYIYALAGCYWFAILVTLTLSDYLTRHWIP